VKWTITKRNTTFQPEGELVFIVRTTVRPIDAAKNTERVIVWFNGEKFFRSSHKIKNLGGEQVDKKHSSEKGIISIF
jgi:hypothetical protein